MDNVISHEQLWFFRKGLAIAQTVFLKIDITRLAANHKLLSFEKGNCCFNI